MNMINTVQTGMTARLFALLTIVSLLMSAFPVAFFVAQATSGSIELSALADPDVVSDSNGEYIEIAFTGSGSIDLTDWTIEDDAGVLHTIGSFFIDDSTSYISCVNDNEAVNNAIGCGEEWSPGGPLNNDGDTVTLKDAFGVVVATLPLNPQSGVVESDEFPFDDSIEENEGDTSGETSLAYSIGGKVQICKFNEGNGGQYVSITPSVNSAGELTGGHTNDNGTAPQNIIPPYEYLDDQGKVLTFAGRNWDDGQAIWENDCQPTSPDPVDFCDPAQKPDEKSIAEWHDENQFDGSSCFTYKEVAEQCGTFDVNFTSNETGLNFGFNYVLGTEVPQNFEDGNAFPATFTEDENGGSVELTYYVVGKDKDYFVGSDVPNFWDGTGETVIVDTDCENDVPPLEIPHQCSVKVDEFSVPANSATGANTNISLDADRDYFAVVEGTYTFGAPKNGDERLADAEYSLDAGNTEWVKEFDNTRPDVLDLFIDGTNPDFGVFRSDHTYGTFLLGTGAPSNFAILDDPYTDNSGSLEVTLYECEIEETPEEEIGLPNCSEHYSEGTLIQQNQILLSHDEGGAFIGPRTTFIPAGTYDINALSYEQHSIHLWDRQENETWFVNLYDRDNNLIFTSETTDDVPTGIDFQESELDRSVTLPDVTAIEWVHAAYPDPTYQSVYPLCIQFTQTEEGAGSPKPTYSITGVKWNDLNGDGIQDDGEPLLDNWTISATYGDDLLTGVTNEFGEYEIEVPAGQWTVSEQQQIGWTQTGTEVYDDPSSDLTCMFSIGSEESYYSTEDSAESALPEYVCDFGNQEDPTTTITRNSSRSGSDSTRVDRSFAPAPPAAPLVAGASTDQCPFLLDHMQMGWENDPMEVMKLQLFLNIFKDMYGGTANPVTGNFGIITDTNVKAFQSHFRSEVLVPWFNEGIVGHTKPTGFVYKTTNWKINDLVCGDEFPSLEGETLETNVDLNSRAVQD